MKKALTIACMLLVTFVTANAQTDTAKKQTGTRSKSQPRGDRKKIIGKDTAGWPHNRTPQWPRDSMRRNSNNVERLHNKKDTVNTLKKP